VGIHAAADGEYDWRWYGNLVGAYFRNHPAGTPTATVVTEDTTDPSTYAEDDGNATDDDHPISWCQRYDGRRSFYTGLGHTQASFAEPGILSHIGAGIEIAAGVLSSAACGVAPPSGGTDVPVDVGGTVPAVLALTVGATPSLGTFMSATTP
jgi:hypothetical protein